MCCAVWVKEGPERNTRILSQRRSVFQETSPSVAEKRARRHPKTGIPPAHDATLDAQTP